jgi:hypothetical protein
LAGIVEECVLTMLFKIMKFKNGGWLGLVAIIVFPVFSTYSQPYVPPASVEQPPASPAATVSLSPGAAEVVRLSESGVGEDVITAYIQGSQSLFNLSADDILYLKDVGLTSPVVTAMLSHDTSLRNRQGQYKYDQKLYPPSSPAQPSQLAPQAAVPAQPPVVAPAPEAVQPTAVSNPPEEVSYFYNDLSPYGSWVQLEGYGWCWQPTTVVVNRAWRPYCDGGHWVYSDAGWCWQSDYSWGWAPFHYGRWYLHDRCGWVWFPDRVWAPAWVTWRVAGDNCGWAPLPPHAYFDARSGYRYNGVSVGINFDFGLHANHFTFVALKDFSHHDIGHRRLPPAEVKNVYNHTTVINNYVINNNTIVNKGVAVEQVAAVTHTPIKKVAIRDVPANSGPAIRAEALKKNEPVIYRPQLKAPAKIAPVTVQKVDARHPVIQHTAVTPVKVERKTVSNSPYAPAVAPRNFQTENPNSSRPQPVQKTAPLTPNTPSPAVRQPITPSSPTPSIPAPQHQDDLKQSSRPGDINKSDSGSHSPSNPSSSSVQKPANLNTRYSQNPNARVYYPKGYNPPAATRNVPRNNPSQAAPSKQDNNRDEQQPRGK